MIKLAWPKVDTHTHTVISGHAFSTLLENVKAASQKGLSALVMSEHGPRLTGGAPEFLLDTYSAVPETIDGVRLYRGAEADIINDDGELDIRNKYLRKGDFIIASLHRECYFPTSKKDNTRAMIGALKNPFVDAIGHPGNPVYEVDIEAVVEAAKKYEKCLEINGHSFAFRPGSRPNCERIIELCRDGGVRVCVGSDAHFTYRIADFGDAMEALCRLDFPQKLIVNTTLESFEEYRGFRRERRERQLGL